MALQYRGRSPDSDAIIVPMSYADSAGAAKAVTTDYVNAQISAQITNQVLKTPTYVDTQDGLRATKAAVAAADATYLAASTLNAPNGVAGLDSSGDLIASQIPAGIVTDRVFTTVVGTNTLSSSGTQTVYTNNFRETSISYLNVPDPGYAWRPFPFAIVQGGSTGGSAPNNRTAGNGVYGLLAVVPQAGVSDTVYAATVCTSDPHYTFYPVFPYALSGQTPANTPPITGSLRLDLYASCFIGSGYSFKGLNLSFWCWVVPAVGG